MPMYNICFFFHKTAKPIGTTTRGEITAVAFSKDNPVIGFEIHLKSGEIWHLKSASHVCSNEIIVILFKHSAALISILCY